MIKRIRERKEAPFAFHLFYNLLLPIGILAYWIYASLFKKKKLAPLGERLGRLPKEQWSRLNGKSPIWIQAVSVGEAASVGPLIELIHKENPEIPVVMTTTTPKGFELCQRLEQKGVIAAYFPLDLPQAMRRFIRQINPKLLIMIETEFWPNCISEAAKRGCPMVVINGRVSERSFPRYKIFQEFARQFLSPVSYFLMQSELDAERLGQLGIPEEKVKVMGNLKFDAALANEMKPASLHPQFFKKGAVWVAASTHEPEEKQLYQIYRKVRESVPSIQWVVAPRHVERAKTLKSWFLQQGEKILCWSEYQKNFLSPDTDGTILLVDTMGELSRFYAASDIVFIGGSLIPHGGQNPLEPASFGKAILFGPHMFNFRQITCQLLEQGGAIQCQTLSELPEALTGLLQNPNQAKMIGEKAQAVIQQNRGATERAFQFLLQKNLL